MFAKADVAISIFTAQRYETAKRTDGHQTLRRSAGHGGLVGDDTEAVDGDDEVVAQSADFAGGRELDHALVEFGEYFEADDLALFQMALSRDVADVEGLLSAVGGIRRRVVACDGDAGAGVAPRPALADVAELLEGDGWGSCGHSCFLFMALRRTAGNGGWLCPAENGRGDARRGPAKGSVVTVAV